METGNTKTKPTGQLKRSDDIILARNHLLALFKDMSENGHEVYAEHILYILRTALKS